MKKVNLVFVMLTFVLLSFGQSQFEVAMLQNIDSLYQSKNTEALQKTINAFERIAQADTTRWEPLYYATYGYCQMSLREQNNDKKDALCDKGEIFLNKALAKFPNESELYVLKGFLLNMRLVVNTSARASIYIGPILTAYAIAEKMNPENPRIYYMKGNLTMNLPDFMGGGKEAALPIFKLGKEKFDTFTSSNLLMPRWGRDDCINKIKECSM
ncbi:MAG: hypothetical protein IPO21_16785 [Bacteroidales bacterium]|nr:hypothetical protein [Bacteroidales bacterium]